jgi:hypothetical protein
MSNQPLRAVDEVDEELAQLRKRSAELAVARAAREAAQSRANTIAQLKREIEDGEAIEAAEAEHGEIGKEISVVETDMGVMIVKRAHVAAFKKFQDQGKLKTTDLERLVMPCIVYPSADRRDEILERLPATLSRLAGAIAALAGAKIEEVSSK